MKAPQLKQTKNYNMFVPNEQNRDVDGTKMLEKSMLENGYDEGLPIRCVQHNTKLKITHGHHRFHVARKLGLPVWYIVASNKNLSLFDSESSARAWDIKDYTDARARAGDANAAEVLKYHRETGVPLGAAISLVGGESGGSGNQRVLMKAGTFKKRHTAQADAVRKIVIELCENGIDFASNTLMVNAISKCVLLKEFDVDQFIYKCKTHKSSMERQRDLDSYLGMIEYIYNRQSHNKTPIKFPAIQASKQRKEMFGKFTSDPVK